MRKQTGVVVILALSCGALLAAEPVTFVRKPTAARDGEQVRIQFAVSRATDVAVFVEDAKGTIVRHLVAGMLGPKAPAPLKPDSLEQSITWDGRADHGKPGGDGPFRVRVALGLGAKFDRVLMESQMTFTGGKGGVKGLAVGSDGTLYVLASFGAAVPNWGGERIVALNRDGTYIRTVAPFPASMKTDQVRGLGVMELDGRPVPLVHSVAGRSFLGAGTGRKTGMAVTPDGVILRPVGGYRAAMAFRLSAVGIDGGAPWGRELGPPFLKLTRGTLGRPFVVASSDGKTAYVTGPGQRRPDKKPSSIAFAAVYRVRLPGRGPAAPFFGKPEEPGDDETHLAAGPRGLAVDGKGSLYIADYGNNRVVVVLEEDASFIGSFPVEAPDHVAVDPKTGAVFVTRLVKNGVELVKFRNRSGGAPVAKLALRAEGDVRHPWVMTLDATARPAVVWMGGDRGSLLRIEDKGDAFGEAVRVNKGGYGNAAFVDVNVDRFRPDREVYVRCGQGNWYRFSEGTGKITNVRIELPGGAGSQVVPGPKGNLYCVGWPYHLLRFTRDGKPLPWPETLKGYPDTALGKTGKMEKLKRTFMDGRYVPVSMTFTTHTLALRPNGRIAIFEPSHHGDRPPKMLCEYLPTGERVDGDPAIWKVSDTAIGPKFDAAGNIYVAEQVKPVGRPYPDEFVKLLGPLNLGKNNGRSPEQSGVKGQMATMYGSIVKFSPKGGMFHFGGEDPFGKRQPKLDPSLKTVAATSYHGNRLYPLKVTGAEWIRMGISHVDLFYCNCENTRFDVDEFGRVWYPDLGRFRVCVLDTNGNDITHFGRYGNADTRDAIAFAWLIGVGVTDRYAYMGDSLNRRLMRAKLTYAAEETCDVK